LRSSSSITGSCSGCYQTCCIKQWIRCDNEFL